MSAETIRFMIPSGPTHLVPVCGHLPIKGRKIIFGKAGENAASKAITELGLEATAPITLLFLVTQIDLMRDISPP